MIYRIKSQSWDEVWTGSFDELVEHNPDLPDRVRGLILKLKPGQHLDCSVLGVSYSVACRAEDDPKPEEPELGPTELMARAIETLLDELRQRGVWPSDIQVDLTGYETYRAAHPRQDS
jgi:hypothetical protein